MEKIPREKLVEEMFEKTIYEEYKMDKHMEHIVENLAIILSLATIFILLVLYSFKNGYYQVYNISTNCITVDLVDFLPAALQFCGIFIYLVFYMVQIKKDNIMKINRPNFLRILYGELIIYGILIYNNIDHLVGSIITIIISFAIPIVIEVFWWLMKKPRKNKEYNVSVKNIVLTGMVEDKIEHLIMNKYLVGVVVIIISLASPWGSFCAKAENKYQIFPLDTIEYAVIVDRKDAVIAERIFEENGILNVDTSSYIYLPKDNIVFSEKEFEKVVIE